jgi:integral membrane sensor domain MASE1
VAEGSPTRRAQIIFGLAVLGSGLIGNYSMAPGPGRILPLVWIPIGLIAGAIVVTPRRQWPRLGVIAYIALVAAALVVRAPAVRLFAVPAIYVVEGWLAGALLQRITGTGFDLATLPHLLALIAVAFVVPSVGGLAVVSALRAAHVDIGSFGLTWVAAWAVDAFGVLLGAPLVFGWRDYPAHISSPAKWRPLEAIALCAAIVVMAEVVFAGYGPDVMHAPAFIMPLFFIAIFRFGPAGTAAAMWTVALVALPNVLAGHGPYFMAAPTPLEATLRGQVVGMMAAVSFYLLASLVAERRRISHDRAELVVELQRALTEIKTLQGFIPLCAWCHKIRDDEGFWQEIESYLHAHTDATVSHGICPACAAREHLAIEQHSSNPAGSRPS